MLKQIQTPRLWLAVLSIILVAVGCDRSPQATMIPTENSPQATVTTAPSTKMPMTSTPVPAPTEHPTPLPTPIAWVYPTPPANWTPAFSLGGHIRTWDYIGQMKYAGMTWAKQQIHFPQDSTDTIAKAHDLGLKIQLTGLGSVDHATQGDFVEVYSTWVAELAAAGADAIEVWNEPNIDREWPRGAISAADYTNLLCNAYTAIKAANPDTAVISAAPAPTGYFGGCTPEGCDDIPFLQGMVAAGAVDCLDYVGAHYAAGATSPSSRQGHPASPAGSHHSWYFLSQTELYHELFEGRRQLFYTEMGYASQEGVPTFADSFAWARDTDNAQQAAWLAEAVQLSIDTEMVHTIIVWNVDFRRYGYDPQDGYAIIRPDGSCPSCEALHPVLFPDSSAGDD